MGVGVVPGRGGGRGVGANLNLVPFIDLLSTLITFLIATAVWVELSSLPVDQHLSEGHRPMPPVDTQPPLTVHVRADGVWLGRVAGQGHEVPAASGAPDWTAVDRALAADRAAFPDEVDVVVVTDDGVEYRHMIAALDRTRAHGYAQALLGGGPARVGQ